MDTIDKQHTFGPLIYFNGKLPGVVDIAIIKVESITDVDNFKKKLPPLLENLLSHAPNTIFDFSSSREVPSALLKELNRCIAASSSAGRNIRVAAVCPEIMKLRDVVGMYKHIEKVRDDSVDASTNWLSVVDRVLIPVD